MLASTSRRLAKSSILAKRRTGAVKTRKYSTKIETPPHLKLPVYQGAELKNVQAMVEQINSNPAQLKAANKIVNFAKQRHELSSAFWHVFSPAYGVKVPEQEGLQKEIFGHMVLATLDSWEEYIYALRSYQSKLQQDAEFYKTNQALKSTDAKEAKKAQAAVVSFIQSIPTKSELAKRGILHLIRRSYWDAIKSGEATRYANEYLVRFKREVKVELTTAQKLTPQEEEHWAARFRQAANDERTKIIMTTKEDPSILGGAIININGDIYDESWKRQQDVVMNAVANFNSL